MKKFLSNIIRVICIAILGLFVLQVLFTIILNLVSENEHEKGLTGANQQIKKSSEVIVSY